MPVQPMLDTCTLLPFFDSVTPQDHECDGTPMVHLHITFAVN
jgi:hypothetical protein